MIESLNIFNDFTKFINKMCVVAQTSQVEYESQYGKKLNLIDQICHNFFNQILLGHFLPTFTSQEQNYSIVRTQYQIFLQILNE